MKEMSRKNFMMLVFAVMLFPVFIIHDFLKNYQEHRKQELIARALSTHEGRRALARSMIQPLRTSLNYSDIGRKIFSVEALP